MSISVQVSSNKGDPRLYARQRRLLALLDALGGAVGNLDFQKLLFLYCQEFPLADQTGAATSLYEFVPYRYGAFSFTCYADRRRLIDHGLLIDQDQEWVLTEGGKSIAGEAQDSVIRAFSRRYHGLRGEALIAETYRRYPYYAIRSEIADRILQNDEVVLCQIRAARPNRDAALLFTIGYEGRTPESYLNELIRSSVTMLCDVRRNAISRKYGFSKTTLAKACAGVGIRYEHLPELGIESRRRRGLETQEDFDSLFRTYEQKILPMLSDSLERIHTWLRSGESVALTCYEREADQCHRYYVTAALEQILDHGGPSDQPVRPHPAERGYAGRHL